MLGAEFVRLGPGEFVMGSPPTEPDRGDDERSYAVRLTRPFWFGVTEITQEQWRRVTGESPSTFDGCPACPVESVSAIDVRRFLDRLRFLEPEETYRLPTEAEWEFACRAGGTEAYGHRGRLLAGDANFDARYPLSGMEAEPVFLDRTVPVASYAANPWGLHDLSGNVWEWTGDPYCEYPTGDAVDPAPRCGSALLVIRGGSWTFGADAARCAMRNTHRPEHDGYSIGLRLVREAPGGR